MMRVLIQAGLAARKLVFHCVFIAACGLPHAAAAQQGQASTSPDLGGLADERSLRDWELTDQNAPVFARGAEAELALSEVATCVVKRESARDNVVSYLRSAGFKKSRLANSEQSRLRLSDCPSDRGQLRFEEPAVSRALFTALYTENYGADVPNTLPPGPDSLIDAGLAEMKGKDAARSRGMRAYGLCVAENSPAQAHAFVVSDLRSDEEALAVHALQPALARCLGEERKLSFSRTILKGVVAEGLYLARSAEPAVAAGN